jgi:hypothetical protein
MIGQYKRSETGLVDSNKLRAVIGGETTVESHVGVHLHHQGHVLVSSLLQHGGHRVYRVHRTCCTQGADPPLAPSSLRVGKAGRNHLNEEITPLLPTGPRDMAKPCQI